MRRVAVTGIGAISPLGSTWNEVEQRMRKGENAVQRMPEWAKYDGLSTLLGVPVTDFETPSHWTRKQTRSMGRVARLAVASAERAIKDACLEGSAILQSGRTGVAYGSSSGSPEALTEFADMRMHRSTTGLNATTYVRMMGHTAAVNIGVFFGLTGRIIPTSSACTSGSQGIGYAYEAIKYGQQDIMLAGGAEELCPTEAAVFDTLYATSTVNDKPEATPRPFDKNRDGLVIGEGACTLILENYDHAVARGANIYCEILGYGTNSDGVHITQPSRETMQRCIMLALEDAQISKSEIGYVSAHGTATPWGDIAESHATLMALDAVPISSIKSYVGHTLGACGSLEAWWAIEMMRNNWYAPTLNLTNPDPECADLDYIVGDGREMNNEIVMSNNFAFGGINTSLIFLSVS
jgi:3-oxoacyl-[acyl-carrier-protein] synthase II